MTEMVLDFYVMDTGRQRKIVPVYIMNGGSFECSRTLNVNGHCSFHI